MRSRFPHLSAMCAWPGRMFHLNRLLLQYADEALGKRRQSRPARLRAEN